MKIGDRCQYCDRDEVIYVPVYRMWGDEHLACPTCNSTYVLPIHTTVKLFDKIVFRTPADNVENLTKALAQCLYFDDSQWKGNLANQIKT